MRGGAGARGRGADQVGGGSERGVGGGQEEAFPEGPQLWLSGPLAFPLQVSFLSCARTRFPGLLTIPPPQGSNWKGWGAVIGILGGGLGTISPGWCGILARTLGDLGLPVWLSR